MWCEIDLWEIDVKGPGYISIDNYVYDWVRGSQNYAGEIPKKTFPYLDMSLLVAHEDKVGGKNLDMEGKQRTSMLRPSQFLRINNVPPLSVHMIILPLFLFHL